ncbi:MAG: AAA family ATPase [Ruminococcus sp.]
MTERKAIPIGKEDFKELIDDNCCFVDKTLLIRDIIDSGAKVSLFTRPRRFGKTLNMSMLRRYFERTEQDNSYLFEGLKISGAGNKYKKYMGQYPVISISLKGVGQSSYEEAFYEFKNVVAREVWRHKELLKSDNLMPSDRKKLEKICSDEASDSVYNTSLKLLSDSLFNEYGKQVVVLIDEYDVPLQSAYKNGYYDKMVKLIRSVFESVLKTNDSLDFAVLTGCLRISKESIFTGLNNLKVNSIKDIDGSEYFGFTETEVKELADYYGVNDKFDEIKKWYDGYLFGKTEIYNPWSVLNYINTASKNPDAPADQYWSNTSSNDIIHELILKGDRNTKNDVETLVTGGSVEKPLYDDITYNNIDVNSDYVWSFLLHTGYLKPLKIYQNGIQNYFTAVIPNTEIVTIYENTFRKWFNESVRAADKSVLLKAVLDGDAEKFELEVNRWLLRSISFHDGYENFYHGFLVGLLEYSDEFLVESNRENGTGRSDIVIKNVLTQDIAVIIEIKSVSKGKTLEQMCDTALKQIEDRQYETSLLKEGYKNIINYGIAFEGKRCKIKKK